MARSGNALGHFLFHHMIVAIASAATLLAGKSGERAHRALRRALNISLTQLPNAASISAS
jgi:hypothetical protein